MGAPPVGHGGRVALRLDAALLVLMWIGGFVAYRACDRSIGRDFVRATILLLSGLLASAACAPRVAETESAGAPEPMPVRAYPESAIAQDPDSALRAELLAMGEEDQAVRAGLTPERMQDTAFLKRIERTDSARSRRLMEIVRERGWPDADRVGADAVNAAFLVVQHTPFDAFREAMLPHVERDVRRGVLDAQSYAGMVDRIRTHRGQPQLYGTQYSLEDGVLVRDPVEDPTNLDRRRTELGLMPIAEYERLLAEYYHAEVRAD